MEKSNKRYLVACSGGPDSMALLDMFKDKYTLVVCHVNYHHRDTATRDERIVRKYCRENGIILHVFNYKDKKGGNFQDKARVFRYSCFKKCVLKDKLDGVLVGHHKDDLIETYFMQQERNAAVSYWGINKQTEIMDVKIIRPLLKYTKKQLEEYCVKHHLNYGIDESNLTDVYRRNQIRHNRIAKMSNDEKNKVVKEINLRNKQELIENKAVKKFIGKKDHFEYKDFMSFKYLKKLIRSLIANDLSDKHLDEIIKALKSKENVELKIHNKFIFKEYGYIEIKDVPEDYCYSFNSLKCQKHPYFEVNKSGTNFEGVTVNKKDMPLTIRNYKNGDSIKMLYGTKKINRYFIDHKISSYRRKIWPVVLNSKKEIILVPGIGCNKDHYSKKHNLYVKAR